VQHFLQAKLYKNLADPGHRSYEESLGLLYCSATLKLNPEAAFEAASWCLRADKIRHFKEKFPRTDFNTSAEWAQAIISEIDSNLLPKAEIVANSVMATLDALAQSAATFSGDSFKEELALEEPLDAAIDRKIKRLMMLKAAKPVLGLTSAQRGDHQPKKLVEKKTPVKRVHFPDAA
jgi:hypothetical protein